MTMSDASDVDAFDVGGVPHPALDSLPAHSAARELADALGRPALARRVTELCGNNVGLVLAEAVTAAVERRTRAMEVEVAEQLEVAHAAIRARWEATALEAPDDTWRDAGDDAGDDAGGHDIWAARVDWPGR